MAAPSKRALEALAAKEIEAALAAERGPEERYKELGRAAVVAMLARDHAIAEAEAEVARVLVELVEVEKLGLRQALVFCGNKVTEPDAKRLLKEAAERKPKASKAGAGTEQSPDFTQSGS